MNRRMGLSENTFSVNLDGTGAIKKPQQNAAALIAPPGLVAEA
jgi:hypothetical protein